MSNNATGLGTTITDIKTKMAKVSFLELLPPYREKEHNKVKHIAF